MKIKRYDIVFCLPKYFLIGYPGGGENIVNLLSGHISGLGFKVAILYIDLRYSMIEKKNVLRIILKRVKRTILNLIVRIITLNHLIHKLFHKIMGHDYPFEILKNVDLILNLDNIEIGKFFATAWQTAGFVSDYAKTHLSTKAYYLIQNFESEMIFSGKFYKEAENSYSFKNLKKTIH